MSTKYQDYYQTLGVSRTATQEEIQRAYRKLAREFHPDMNKAPDAEKKFKAINEANEVLGDADKRKRYDELGENWKAGQEFRPPAGNGTGARGYRVDFGRGGAGSPMSGDFSDFFESLFGGQGRASPFGGMDMDEFAQQARGQGSERGRKPRARAGATQEAEITISLADAYHGGTRHVTLQSHDESGETTTRSYDVRIPAGITDGSTIRLGGQGSSGSHGGPSGDLLLKIHLAPDPRFRIDPDNKHDLIATVPISPWEAALGAKVPVPTFDAEILVTIPAGAQSGQKLRIRGKGLPKKSEGHGDLYAELKIAVPKTLTPEDRKLFEQLAETSKFDPRAI